MVGSNFAQPQTGTVSAAYGSWVVPTVTGPPTGNAHSSVWVGIDVYGNGTVEHVGTAQHAHHGVATYVAWWEMRSKVGHQPQQTIHSMTVNRSYQFGRGLRGELQSVSPLKC